MRRHCFEAPYCSETVAESGSDSANKIGIAGRLAGLRVLADPLNQGTG